MRAGIYGIVRAIQTKTAVSNLHAVVGVGGGRVGSGGAGVAGITGGITAQVAILLTKAGVIVPLFYALQAHNFLLKIYPAIS